MKLAIYNGSPRGKVSNSQVFANLLAENFDSTVEVSNHYLKNIDKHDEIIKSNCDSYFVVFPLYTDITPYCVKVFFEKMEENKEAYKDKPIYFFVHSGFPEAKQSRLLERYLKYFCSLIDAKCMGVCIMGNSEMVRKLGARSKKYKKINDNIKNLAKDITDSKPFNSDSIEYFKRIETLSKSALFIFKIIPMVNMWFNFALKRNGAYDKRFDKPYA